MLGAFAVGKTSLVGRFVHSIYSDKYHTTIGVKVDKKSVNVGGDDVVLLLWDIYGEDDVQEIRLNYIRGTSGYLLVIDGTRPDTLDVAKRIRRRIEESLGHLPFVLLVNKSDLTNDWKVTDDDLAVLRAEGWQVEITSAKTGAGVEDAFQNIAAQVAAAN